jgi:4-hydroxyproline epimerase
MKRIGIVDSHTGGEPTRLVLTGAPDLGQGSVKDRLARLRDDNDWLRKAVVLEPRGSDVIVGALLLESDNPACHAGVIFFNNVGYLGMCGHGTIGVVATLAHLGRIKPGVIKLETAVGEVSATLHDDGTVSVTNVPSYRRAKAVSLEVEGIGRITGDVAWAGNWFFLTENHGKALEFSQASKLTEMGSRIRAAVNAQGYPEVDHVELFGPPADDCANSRSFVLCPGLTYDRSPCGTGTSAKLACLAVDGKLAEGARWVQESIIGSRFEASFRWLDEGQGIIEPTIQGRAFVTAESTLLLDESDPFRWGIS